MASSSGWSKQFSSRSGYILSLVPQPRADSGDEEEEEELSITDEELLNKASKILEVFIEERFEVDETPVEGIVDAREDTDMLDLSNVDKPIQVKELVTDLVTGNVIASVSQAERQNDPQDFQAEEQSEPQTFSYPSTSKHLSSAPCKKTQIPIRKPRRIQRKKQAKQIKWRKSNSFAGAVSLPPTSGVPKDSLHPTSDSKPVDYFYEFFSDDVLDLIAEQSNLYSVQQTGASVRFTNEDIKDFLAWELLTGVVVMPSYVDYYSRTLRYEKVASIMSLKKLQKIRRFIHFADNSQINNDRFFKVRPIIEAIRQRCLSIEEEDKFSIDEMMIGYKGRKAGSPRQFMKDKPVRWGFKFYVRAGISGIIYDFFPFSGADTFQNFQFTNKEIEKFSFSSFCVLALCQTIKSPALKAVYFDNFFSSPELVLCLRKEYGILVLATLRANRSRGADIVLKTDKELKNEGRGSYDQVSDSKNKISIVKWYDNKPVLLISSYIGIGEAKTIPRYNRSTKKKENVKCPECIGEYNAFMGGVDLSDMLLSLYKSHFKSRRWYSNIFAQMIDISVNNSWLLYKRDHPNDKISLKDFRVQVAEEILLYRRPKKGRPSSRSPTPTILRQPTTAINDNLRYDEVGHMPHFDTKVRCRNCQVGQTTVRCRKCLVRLCFTNKKNCFEIFHSKV